MGREIICAQVFKIAFIFIVLNLFGIFNCASGRNTPATASKLSDDKDINDRIPIGVVFGQNTNQIQNAFKFAMVQHANNKTSDDYLYFQVYVDVINTADVFKLSRLVCNQFSRGVVAILASVHPDSFATFHSYANSFHMPFVAPSFPEKVPNPTSGMPDYAISMLPDYHKAVLDTVSYYGWKNVIYLYDSLDGMLRLQQLFSSMMPGKSPYFRIANIRKVNNARDVIGYLKELEKADRWSNKYVILDCTTTLAKETLIHHVRDVTLGRRNYHYLFAGLVLDDVWEPGIREYGTINMTGFKVIDTSRKYVKDIINLYKDGNMSAQEALMYDAVQTLLEAFQRIAKKKPHIIEDLMNKTNHQHRFLNCNATDAKPLKYGDEIAEFIKRTVSEGLTGKIRFTNAGVRKDFSLIVVQNSPDNNLIKIATWYVDKGFQPVKKLNENDTSGKYDRMKTYIVVSIQEPPYFTYSQPRKNTDTEELGDIEYGGFCADLALLIAEKLGINIQFRLVADGKFGGVNPNVIGGWDGMVGELARKEADMVIAPFIVTEEREAVIDFSKPFLSFNRINEKSETDKDSWLAFLRPLSKGSWILLAISIVLVSVVMFFVAKLSMEWNEVGVSDPTEEMEANGSNTRPTVINEFSFSNSIWYSVSSMMQQGSHVSPRSLSGRIVSTVWWFFVLVFVCSYTAHLASQLTVNSISSPHAPTYTRMAHCPEDIDGNSKEEIIPEMEGYGNIDDTFLPKPKDYAKSVTGCDMLVSAVDPGIKDFAVGFPKGSKLRADVNIALTAIREEGEINRLLRKHFLKTSCEMNKPSVGGSELTLEEVVGLFYILVSGLGLAMVIALVQYCRRYRSDIARAKVPNKTSIHSNSRLHVDEIQETRNTTRRRRHNQERWNGAGNAPGSYAGPLEEVQEVAGRCSPILQCPGTPVFNSPAASCQSFLNRQPLTPLHAITELPIPQVAQRNGSGRQNRANLNAPFSSSPCSLMNVSSIGLRQGMPRQRSRSALEEANANRFNTYFTPNANGPEDAALRNSYTQV